MTVESYKNLSKKDIVKEITLTIGTSSENIHQICENIIEAVINILLNKNKVNIKNFGSFNILYKNERPGRNPKTNQIFTVKSRKVINFKASNTLKKKINEI